MIKGHDVLLPAPVLEGDQDSTFAETLHAVEIIARAVTHSVGQDKEKEEEYNFDNLDFE